MMKKFLKSLSLVMALVMCFTMVFTAAVAAEGEATITLTVADTVEPGTVSITVDASNFDDVAGVQGELTVAGLDDATVTAGIVGNVVISDGIINFAQEGEPTDDGSKLSLGNGTLFTISGIAVEGTDITFTWNSDEVMACDTDEIELDLVYADKTVTVGTTHVHDYVDGICACGDYQYDVVWGDITYNLLDTKLTIPYNTTTDSELYALLTTYTFANSNRSVDVVLNIDGTEYPFVNIGIGATPRYYGITGFSMADMAADIDVFIRVTYTADGVDHAVYCEPYSLKINDMLAADATLDAELYAKYVALCDAVAADEAAEVVSMGASDTDVVYSIGYSPVANAVRDTFNAGASDSYVRTLLAQYPAPGGRDVGVVLTLNGAEFPFYGVGIGNTDRTYTITGFSLLDLSSDMKISTRVYHYGANDNYAAYTDASNSVEFNVAELVGTGTSDAAIALAEYLAAAYPVA